MNNKNIIFIITKNEYDPNKECFETIIIKAFFSEEKARAFLEEKNSYCFQLTQIEIE